MISNYQDFVCPFCGTVLRNHIVGSLCPVCYSNKSVADKIYKKERNSFFIVATIFIILVLCAVYLIPMFLL